MENDNPTAQGSDPAAPEGAGEISQSQVSGIEKRMGELTARWKSAAEESAAKDAQIAQLVQALASREERVAQPEVQMDIDPDDRRKMESVISPAMKRLEQQYAQLERRLQTQQVQHVVSKVKDPRVAQRALQLEAQWAQRGLPGWTAEDAVRYAAGEIALADQEAGGQAALERDRFNRGGSPVLAGHANPPAPRNQNTRPANLESKSLEEQIAFYEKSIGDEPF